MKFYVIFYILLITLYCFLEYFQGFLLTRHRLTNNFSTCSDLHDDYDYAPHKNYGYNCWIKPPKNHHHHHHHNAKFQKIIFFIIDALRYDFTTHFPTIQNLLRSNESESRCHLYKFISDSPTTTTCRLEGLTVGTIPTQNTIRKSFSSQGMNIDEDNMIKQIVMNGKRLVVMGDDTWGKLYSNDELYARKKMFDSYNVWDLYTVDNNIMHYLMDEIKYQDEKKLKKVYDRYKNETGVVKNYEMFDVLIAHFLGLDHSGHRYGIYHEKTMEKLMYYDAILKEIIENLPDETLLLVFGDHGITETGDHGGNSKYEIETALFAYSKKEIFKSTKGNKEIRTVNQIDLVPTVSLLLDIPIPYNNLGLVIEEFFGEDSDDMLELNAWQIKRFVEHYIAIEKDFLSVEEIREMNEIYDKKKYKQFIKYIEKKCRQKWNVYNTIAMFISIVLTFICIVVMLSTFFLEINKDNFNRFKGLFWILNIIMIGICLLLWFLPKYRMMYHVVFVCVLIVYWKIYWNLVKKWTISYRNLICIISFVVYLCCMFSNNGIIHEDLIVIALIAINIFVLFFKQLKTMKSLIYYIVIVGCLYFSFDTIKLRSTETHIIQDKSIEIVFRPIISVFALLIVLFLLVLKNKNYIKLFGFVISFLLMYAYWYIDYFTKDQDYLVLKQYIPYILYFLCFLQIFILSMYSKTRKDVFHHIFECILIVLLFIKGYYYIWVFVILLIEIFCFLELMKKLKFKKDKVLHICLIWYYFSKQFFFALGSQYTFTTFQIKASVIGNMGGNLILSFILVSISFVSSKILFSFSLPMTGIGIFNDKIHLYYFSFQVMMNFVDQICSYVLLQHLMLWEVFAPKLFLEGFNYFFIEIFILLGNLLFNSLKKDKIITKKNK